MSQIPDDKKEGLKELNEFLDIVNTNLHRILANLSLDQRNELKSSFTELSEQLEAKPGGEEIKNMVKDFRSLFARIIDLDLLEATDPTAKLRAPEGPSRVAYTPKKSLPDIQQEKLIAQKIRDIAAKIGKPEKKQK